MTLEQLKEDIADAKSISPDHLVDAMEQLISQYESMLSKKLTTTNYQAILDTFQTNYPYQPIPDCLKIK